jgi:hypothetical protein
MMAGGGTLRDYLHWLSDQVDVREGAHNANPYSAHLGRPAQFWCSDFLVAGRDIVGVPEVNRGTASAFTPTAESGYKKAGRLTTTPHVGDQGFVFDAKEGRISHTFAVIGILPGGMVRTIEGNTNNDGSSNGIGVFIRRRKALRAPGRSGVRSYGRPLYRPPSARQMSDLSEDDMINFVSIKGTKRLFVAGLPGTAGLRPVPNPETRDEIRAKLGIKDTLDLELNEAKTIYGAVPGL